MRRIRLRTGPAALFGAMLAIALLVFLPMRLALAWTGLGDAGLSARAARGTVWSGSLSEARFGDLALGDLRAGVSPFALLIGRARVDLASRLPGAAPSVDGAVSIGRHVFAVEDMTATLPTGAIFAPLPVTTVGLEAFGVRFRDDLCEEAEGRVRLTLAGDVAGVPIAQAMTGTARCDAGALLVALQGQAGTERATLRVTGAGRYTGELFVTPADPVLGQKLELAGFVAGANGYRLAVEGRF